jgi:uncharacterized repeat protein (TIGR01451 family)
MKSKRYSVIVLCVIALSLFVSIPSAIASGTLAGTEITNHASATFTVGTASGLVKNSNINTIKVDELVNVVVTWQDASNVLVFPGSSNEILTYRVANTGNGSESFTLSASSILSGDDFDPALVNIYLDNGNGHYDLGIDTLYQPGSNDPVIAADGSMTIFVLNNIPMGQTDGNKGDSQLTATSTTGAGAPGTVFVGVGVGGTDVVIGLSGGTKSIRGTYLVSSVSLNIVKSSQVTDPFAGNKSVPGATITYSIEVTVTGTGIAENVIIEDAIPSNTAYLPNSLTFNSGALTDVIDGDNGDVSGTKLNTVTVNLGDLTNASPAQTITFSVTIN